MEITTITTAATEAAEAVGRNSSRLVESKNELSKKKIRMARVEVGGEDEIVDVMCLCFE